jgi:hypothetical protein
MTWTRSAIHVALAAALASNLWLGLRLLRLTDTVTELTARPALETGASVPELDLMTANGSSFHLRYSDTQLPTILYVLSPTCKWCARNEESIRRLATATAGRGRFVGVSILTRTPGPIPSASKSVDPQPPPFILTRTPPFPLYVGLSDIAAKQLRLRSTPTTIVVSPAGQVLAVWEGAYAGNTQLAVQRYFSVDLPTIPSN